MSQTKIQAELPQELNAQALAYMKEGSVSDFNELLAETPRRFLESHSGRMTESYVMGDVERGLHGKG
jgi:hypothetical protein